MSTIPKIQKGYVFDNKSHKLTLQDIPVKEPTAGEILLKVEAAGICRSDLHLLSGAAPYPNKFVMGHEVAGTVAKRGAGVSSTEFPLGKLYSVFLGAPCGECEFCVKGSENQCSNAQLYGLGVDGGFQEYMIVKTRSLVAVPDGISAAAAASATDAVLTPYHAIKRAGVEKGSKVLIVGLGGLGMNGVQICKALGAHVTCFDIKDSSRALAKGFGADVVLDSIPRKRLDVDISIDFVGSSESFRMSLKNVKNTGTISTVGMHENFIKVNLSEIITRELTVKGNFGGNLSDLQGVMDLVGRRLVVPQVEVGSFYNLLEHIDQLDKGLIKSRFAVKL